MSRFHMAAVVAVIAMGWVANLASAELEVRKTCDGAELPPITFPIASLAARDKTAKKLDLIHSYLNRAPEEFGKGIRSSKTTESEKLLERYMSRAENYDEKSTGSSGSSRIGGAPGEIHHRTRSIIDKMPTPWFVKDVPGTGANVVGFELADGVVSRMVLYYQRKSPICDALIDAAKSARSSKFVYRVARLGDVTYFDVRAMGPIYLADHPELPANIKRAIESSTLIDGMTMADAEAVFGSPDLHFQVDGNVLVSVIESDGYRAVQYQIQGRPAYSWTLINGTVWTAFKDKNGLLTNVTRKEG